MVNKPVQERKSARPFPAFSLEESLTVARAIQDRNAGKPMNRLLLADAISVKAGSSRYRELLSSSYKYGLTEGTEKAIQITLTPLGAKITKPTSDAERIKGLREAVLKVEIIHKIFDHYNQAKLPSGDFFWNALEREFGIPREHTRELEERLVKDGQLVGFIQRISGAPHIIMDADFTTSKEPQQTDDQELVDVTPPKSPHVPPPTTPNQLFIAHGKNKAPLEQLKAILTGFKVPYKVAMDEAHSGRPISDKVAETMKECTSGIFIFTGDEEVFDKDGNSIRRPSGNVIYELGAASVLFGRNIVIFKEEGVDFPTDFRDLGHITFEKGKLDAKTSDLFKELIEFGILKVSVA